MEVRQKQNNSAVEMGYTELEINAETDQWVRFRNLLQRQGKTPAEILSPVVNQAVREYLKYRG